jgi:hypothetical protein
MHAEKFDIEFVANEILKRENLDGSHARLLLPCSAEVAFI